MMFTARKSMMPHHMSLIASKYNRSFYFTQDGVDALMCDSGDGTIIYWGSVYNRRSGGTMVMKVRKGLDDLVYESWYNNLRDVLYRSIYDNVFQTVFNMYAN